MALVAVEKPQGSRRPAPDVPAQRIMEAIESALGNQYISRATTEMGTWLFDGHHCPDYAVKHIILKDVLGANFRVLQALLGCNPAGIFRKETLREALENLDSKWAHRLSGNHGKHWADKEARLLHTVLKELLKCKRNCTTMSRSPPWLQTLFNMLTDEAPDRSPSNGPNKPAAHRSSSRERTGAIYCGPAGKPMMRWVAPRASSGQPSGRPVIYVVGESPPRAGQQPPDRQVAPGTSFYFNQLQNCAVKICRGEQQVSRTFSKAGLGIREYRWLDGTTWKYDMSPPADQDEDPQEMDDQDGDDENMSDQDAQDNGNYQQDQGGDDGKTWNTKSAMKKGQVPPRRAG